MFRARLSHVLACILLSSLPTVVSAQKLEKIETIVASLDGKTIYDYVDTLSKAREVKGVISIYHNFFITYRDEPISPQCKTLYQLVLGQITNNRLGLIAGIYCSEQEKADLDIRIFSYQEAEELYNLAISKSNNPLKWIRTPFENLIQ